MYCNRMKKIYPLSCECVKCGAGANAVLMVVSEGDPHNSSGGVEQMCTEALTYWLVRILWFEH